jgi:hypothetical protein
MDVGEAWAEKNKAIEAMFNGRKKLGKIILSSD